MMVVCPDGRPCCNRRPTRRGPALHRPRASMNVIRRSPFRNSLMRRGLHERVFQSVRLVSPATAGGARPSTRARIGRDFITCSRARRHCRDRLRHIWPGARRPTDFDGAVKERQAEQSRRRRERNGPETTSSRRPAKIRCRESRLAIPGDRVPSDTLTSVRLPSGWSAAGMGQRK